MGRRNPRGRKIGITLENPENEVAGTFDRRSVKARPGKKETKAGKLYGQRTSSGKRSTNLVTK
jgi:hypothetical protein